MACPDCASTATTRRKGRTALGYRRFRCQACRRRSSTSGPARPSTILQYPTDIVLLAVLWRLRYKLGFRDVAELLLQRGFEVMHETLRAWEVRFAPLLADQLRAKQRGQAGAAWWSGRVGCEVGARTRSDPSSDWRCGCLSCDLSAETAHRRARTGRANVTS